MDSAVAERDIPYQHRVDRYVELGFTDYQAELLAQAVTVEWAKDNKGVSRKWTQPLNWQRVAKALSQGCSHELAVEIFA